MVLLPAGAFALQRLGTQFFPTFSIDFASTQVRWPGAAAGDSRRARARVGAR